MSLPSASCKLVADESRLYGNAVVAQKPAPPRNPFFAYCVGIGVEPSAATLPAQMQLAPMLAELGYDGMALVGLDGAEPLLAELEKHKQKLMAVYSDVNVDPQRPGLRSQAQDAHSQVGGPWHGRVAHRQ